jgi:hypothetical protein
MNAQSQSGDSFIVFQPRPVNRRGSNTVIFLFKNSEETSLYAYMLMLHFNRFYIQPAHN